MYRVLQEFVQKHEGELEVVYALSGWLKSKDPTDHQTRLVTGPKLAGTLGFVFCVKIIVIIRNWAIYNSVCSYSEQNFLQKT